MEFDFEKYATNHAIHCKTEEEAKDFCRVMHEHGLKWFSGESYLNETNWLEYMCDTCYNPRDGKYGNSSTYIEMDYTILEWSDFMKDKKFTKADLKNGDVVKLRNGDVIIYIENLKGFIASDCTYVANAFAADLKNVASCVDSYDIMQVRRPNGISNCCFHAFRDDCQFGTLIYDRERDDPDVEEMTMEEVCKALGKHVKIVDRK